MQPYARCVVVHPCATDGVLRQHNIRSPPAISLLTRRTCICKRWSRLMTARKPLHADSSVTCFAQKQHHLAVSYLAVLHGYQPLVPPGHHFHSAPVHCNGADETRPGSESIWTRCHYGIQMELSRPVSKYSLSIQHSFGVACERVEEREYPSCTGHASQPHSGSPPIDVAHVRALRPYTSLLRRSSIS
jgi:hypothetical protein